MNDIKNDVKLIVFLTKISYYHIIAVNTYQPLFILFILKVRNFISSFEISKMSPFYYCI